MRIDKLSLLTLVSPIKSLHVCSEKTMVNFCTKQTKPMFRQFLINKKMNVKTKYFHITDTTKKRMENIPIGEIKGSKVIGLREKSGETGFVYFNDKLHFTYAITNAGVCIMVSNTEYKQFTEDPLFHISQIMSGFIYIDFLSDHLQFWINNPLDILKNKNGTALKEDTDSINILKKVTKEIEKYESENKVSIKISEENKVSEYSKTYKEQEVNYDLKYNRTKLCLQTFMFIHFAKIIDTTRISVNDGSMSFSERLKNKNRNNNIDVIEVDTLYDENLDVINPFGVKGHWRNQPIGEGRKETKLIYIDSFMKDGYTRQATKTKEGI